MVRLAFIGVGGIAGAHLRNLRAMPDVSIVAVSDLNEERANKVAADIGARAYTDAARMLGEEEIDGLYLCIPPFAHGDAERMAIERGIPFYVEKPIGLDLGLPTEIAQEVARKNLITAVGFQMRYSHAATELKNYVQGRQLGLVNGYYVCPLVTTPWWREQAKSGGQIVEQTIHIVDLMRYVSGDEIKSAYTVAATRVHGNVPNLDIADVHSVSLQFRSGAVGNLISSFAIPRGWHSGVDVIASGLYGRFAGGKATIGTAQGDLTIEDAQKDTMAIADRTFVEAVKTKDGSKIRSPYQDALQTHRLVMAIVRSGQTGEPVAVEG